MFEHFEEKEAVEKAALIEKNGKKFYSLLIDKIDDENITSVLKELLYDEGKHLEILEKKYFPEAGFSDEITEEEIEIEKYVEERGVPDMFTRRINIEKLVDAIDEPKKALLIALDTEVHAVEFFEDLAKNAKTPEGRKMYKELAEEERTHVGHIKGLLSQIE
ncbi:MAG: hypothetical protein KAS88_06250 [Deltaproteobacteria bacterium]|nr:hypothetical protein [Deltaproteobacteria bacterium]